MSQKHMEPVRFPILGTLTEQWEKMVAACTN